jgi:D-glycero-D-manno-heptose 1,7-bisphosphate phosphatase
LEKNIVIVIIQKNDDLAAKLEYQLSDYGFEKLIQFSHKDEYFQTLNKEIGPHIVIDNVDSLSFDLDIFNSLHKFSQNSVLVTYCEDKVENGFWPDEHFRLQGLKSLGNDKIIDCFKSEDIYFYHSLASKEDFLNPLGLHAIPIAFKDEYLPADLYRCALFLDRDGIINVDKEYMYKIEDLEIYENCIDLIKYFNERNYPVCVVTNQSGIAREKYTEEDVSKLHIHMANLLEKKGAKIDEWYISPYHQVGNGNSYDRLSLLRKPYPGMLLQAAKDLPIRMNKSFMIGDKSSDYIHLNNQGLITYHIKRQYDLSEAKGVICKDLSDALAKIKLVLE